MTSLMQYSVFHLYFSFLVVINIKCVESANELVDLMHHPHKQWVQPFQLFQPQVCSHHLSYIFYIFIFAALSRLFAVGTCGFPTVHFHHDHILIDL